MDFIPNTYWKLPWGNFLEFLVYSLHSKAEEFPYEAPHTGNHRTVEKLQTLIITSSTKLNQDELVEYILHLRKAKKNEIHMGHLCTWDA